MWVLTYHSISDGPAPLCIPRDRLAAQLDLLLEAGWRAVEIGAALDSFAPSARSDRPDHRFAVSFDDGYRDFAEVALPVLEARGIAPALFVPAARDRSALPGGITGRSLLEPEQLRTIADRGVEVAGHGIAHVDLTKLDNKALAAELKEGREQLAAWTGRAVRYIAYPFGAFDDRVLAAAAREYAAAFTTQLAAVRATPHPHAIPRIDAYYLEDPVLGHFARRGDATAVLALRRWLRRLRGSEPRRPIPSGPGASARSAAPDVVACR